MWLVALASGAPVLTPPLPGVEDVDWVWAFGFDHAREEGVLRDARGGRRTYDQHDGIDFAIHGYPAMVAGVPVIAPCDGVVVGVRDAHRDHRSVDPAGRFPTGEDCGNGVGLGVGDGVVVQVCHLMQGSVAVAPGQHVARGQVLGLVGWTGSSEFPHVHLSVHLGGVKVDPLRTPDGGSLWDPAALPRMAPGRVVAAGFYPQIPDKLDYQLLPDGVPRMSPSSPALAVGAMVLDVAQGDVVRFELRSPAGELRVHEVVAPRAWAVFRAEMPNPRGDGGLEAGAWVARVTVHRGEAVLAEVTVATVVGG